MRTPVITLYPPWANWVALGWKTIETRTHDRFKSLVGKRIGIHCALKWDKSAIEAAALYLNGYQTVASKMFLHCGGKIICTASVYGFALLTGDDSKKALIDCEHTTRYGLFLDNIRSIPTIEAKGKQGIWYHDIPEDF
jgi:hypothetical protein